MLFLKQQKKNHAIVSQEDDMKANTKYGNNLDARYPREYADEEFHNKGYSRGKDILLFIQA